MVVAEEWGGYGRRIRVANGGARSRFTKIRCSTFLAPYDMVRQGTLLRDILIHRFLTHFSVL